MTHPPNSVRQQEQPGAAGSQLARPQGSASWRILRQALDDDAFDGAELATFGAYTVSWDTIKGLVAIADGNGWWVMDAKELKAIAAATPNDRSQRRSEPSLASEHKTTGNGSLRSLD